MNHLSQLTEEKRRWACEQAHANVRLEGFTTSSKCHWIINQVILRYITPDEAVECITEDILLENRKQRMEEKI